MSKDLQTKPTFSRGQKVIAGASALVLATASQAAITAPDFSGNVTDLATILGAMIGFGAIVWGARRLLSFTS